VHAPNFKQGLYRYITPFDTFDTRRYAFIACDMKRWDIRVSVDGDNINLSRNPFGVFSLMMESLLFLLLLTSVPVTHGTGLPDCKPVSLNFLIVVKLCCDVQYPFAFYSSLTVDMYDRHQTRRQRQ